MSNATLNIRINDELTFTSQSDYRAMTRQGNAVKGREMRDIIEQHYGLGILGRFNHEVIEGVQDSATEGRCIVKASVGSKSNALYFILGYDSTDSIEYRGGSVLASFTNLEDAQKELHATAAIENAIQKIEIFCDNDDHNDAVVVLAEMWGTEQQVTEARRIQEEYKEIAWAMLKRDINRRDFIKFQIMLSIAKRDLDLFHRLEKLFN